MSSTIEIADLTKTVRYEVARVLSPARYIIVVDGLYVLADCRDGKWELSGTPPNAEENAVLGRLIADSGTLDTTTVVVTPPGK